MIYQNITEMIGNTPIVKCQSVLGELACELYVKCEFLNPGGSIKDRIAINMINQAEKSGQIKPGDTLIEPTSGNTGIGLALVGAARGYHVVITMPEKMSQEKQVVLEALGAEIHRTPTEAAWDSPESHLSLAKRLQQEKPNAHILNQYSNPANRDAHYDFTAQEIIDEMGDSLDMIVMGVGTGGTITGIAKHMKEVNPNIQIIGVDPYGSILGGGDEVYPYLVEGIGYDFFPEVLDNDLVDRYIKVNDEDSLLMARRLIREEGLLVGGSSGSAMWAAHIAAASLKAEQKCLVILPDSVRNYMSKFVDDKWMIKQKFIKK